MAGLDANPVARELGALQAAGRLQLHHQAPGLQPYALAVGDLGFVAHFRDLNGTLSGPLTDVPAAQRDRWVSAMEPVSGTTYFPRAEVGADAAIAAAAAAGLAACHPQREPSALVRAAAEVGPFRPATSALEFRRERIGARPHPMVRD